MMSAASMAKRQAERQRYRDRALAAAERIGVTLRCQRAMDGIDDHRLCRGESHGGSGCLCTCHDNPGVAIERGSPS